MDRMKILIKYTETISDNHQGASGKTFERQMIWIPDPSLMRADDLFSFAIEKIRSEYKPIYDEHDRTLLRVNSIEIFP